jgi:hypothetical protein
LGDDAFTGAGGRDIFDYGFKNAGNDIISLRLEVALYPINKSLRSIISALAFVFMFPTVKSLIISLPAFLKP